MAVREIRKALNLRPGRALGTGRRKSASAPVGSVFIGMVVNPKLNTPVVVSWDGHEIYIYRGDRKPIPYEGAGYYETGGDSQYTAPTEVTGYPRAHTPDGVKSKGKGFGTCLYTGLCLGAHQADEGEIRINSPVDGDGISSGSDSRSSSASRWWDMAKKLGLAAENNSTLEEENVDIDVSSDELNRCNIAEGKTINYVNTVNVDLSVEVSADYYTFNSAVSSDLILFSTAHDVDLSQWNHVLEGFWKELIDDDARYPDSSSADVENVNVDAILALDVCGMPKQLFNLLIVVARMEGVGEEDIDMLRLRWTLNIDPQTVVRGRQILLPFKPNAEDGKKIVEALDRVESLRQNLNWSRFSSLP